ncbi:Purine catabolism protein PucG [Planctomycetes bacterium Pan216]|uniref:Purine catabolism protein PucG n=1 Tax=Kolteria novifilia TaxID=2527975 RepID=A0A518BC69_9BACT|nr:Purine catabolism protein PucG [Planctomycetes bacterium Pan216]
MPSKHNAFIPAPRILLGPGPSDVPPRVLQAMATPLVGHLDPSFLSLMNAVQDGLRGLFRTDNQMTLAISGTGSAGMETCIVNLIEPGDSMLVCVNGVFGKRMTDVAERAGAEVHVLERPWGEVFSIEEIEEALAKHKPKAMGIVHAETSTGAWQPVEQLGALCREHDTLLVLDTVTSLGGVPVEIDEWDVDAVYSGTQKCLSCPPGLAPVSFSSRAMHAITNRQRKVQSWYLDINMLANYWGTERAYHHTAPITMNYALYESLRTIFEEGLEARWARHDLNHRALKAGIHALGMRYTAAEGHQLPTLNAVSIPDGVDDAAVRMTLLEDFGIEIGGGLGAFKGKAWRIGLMGHSSRKSNVFLVLSALEQVLRKQGHTVEPGAAVAAASNVYDS